MQQLVKLVAWDWAIEVSLVNLNGQQLSEITSCYQVVHITFH